MTELEFQVWGGTAASLPPGAVPLGVSKKAKVGKTAGLV